jgi:hypothetical protein
MIRSIYSGAETRQGLEIPAKMAGVGESYRNHYFFNGCRALFEESPRFEKARLLDKVPRREAGPLPEEVLEARIG